MNQDKVQLNFKSGVCSLEIFNTKIEDAGTYMCKATNEYGEDSTECSITVQKRGGEPLPPISLLMPSRSSRKVYDSSYDIGRSRSSADVGSGIRPRASEKYSDLVSSSPASDMTKSAYIGRESTPTGFLGRSFNESAIDLATRSSTPHEPTPEADSNGFAAPAKDSTPVASEGISPLKLTSHIAGQVAAPGSSATFEARVDGSADSVTWSRNGSELADSDNIKISESGGTYSLELSNLESSDSGVIQFEGKQGDSTVGSVASLVVSGKYFVKRTS